MSTSTSARLLRAAFAAFGLLSWSAVMIAAGWWLWTTRLLTAQDYRVVHSQGNVSINGHPAKAGQSALLDDITRVETGPRSFATLALSDGSTVTVGADAQLTIDDARASRDQSNYRVRMKLDAGEILRKIPPPGDGINRDSTLITRDVNIGVRGTIYRATAVEGQTRASVLRGAVGLDSDATSREMRLGENYGTVIRAGSAPEAPTVLLPPPILDMPGPGSLLVSAPIEIAWNPVAGAQAYFAELALDPEFATPILRERIVSVSLVIDAELPGDTPMYWRASTVDARELEGRSSEPRLIHFRPAATALQQSLAANRARQALEYAERALWGYADDAGLQSAIGRAHFLLGEHAEALPYFDRAFELAPGSLLNRIWRARARFWLGRLDDSEADYREVLAIDADDPDALWGLAEIDVARKQPETAIERLERVLILQPDHAYAHGTLALAYEQAGDAASARLHAGRQLKLDPGNETAQALLQRLR